MTLHKKTNDRRTRTILLRCARLPRAVSCAADDEGGLAWIGGLVEEMGLLARVRHRHLVFRAR